MSEPDAAAAGQVSRSAAEVYEEFFVPALFAQWPPVLLEAAGAARGDDVLDVGCGTGVLAREAARSVRGSITGLDLNEGMLEVARRSPEPVAWVHGAADDLPFPDRSFDRVVSQFVLMFVPDRRAVVAEMARVLRATGRVAVATWAAIEESPGYAAMAALLERVLGRRAADALIAPFSLGDPTELAGLLSGSLRDVDVVRHPGTARFPSLEAWLHTDIRGWTLADLVDDEQFAALAAAAPAALGSLVRPDGSVVFAVPALVGTGRPV